MIATSYTLEPIERTAIIDSLRMDVRRARQLPAAALSYDLSVIAQRRKEATIEVGKQRIALKRALRAGDAPGATKAEKALNKAYVKHYKTALQWRIYEKYLSKG